MTTKPEQNFYRMEELRESNGTQGLGLKANFSKFIASYEGTISRPSNTQQQLAGGFKIEAYYDRRKSTQESEPLIKSKTAKFKANLM